MCNSTLTPAVGRGGGRKYPAEGIPGLRFRRGDVRNDACRGVGGGHRSQDARNGAVWIRIVGRSQPIRPNHTPANSTRRRTPPQSYTSACTSAGVQARQNTCACTSAGVQARQNTCACTSAGVLWSKNIPARGIRRRVASTAPFPLAPFPRILPPASILIIYFPGKNRSYSSE